MSKGTRWYEIGFLGDRVESLPLYIKTDREAIAYAFGVESAANRTGDEDNFPAFIELMELLAPLERIEGEESEPKIVRLVWAADPSGETLGEALAAAGDAKKEDGEAQ